MRRFLFIQGKVTSIYYDDMQIRYLKKWGILHNMGIKNISMNARIA
jgi:hypothetical protein